MTAPISITLERTFAAPRDLVFRAWAEPDRFLQWWGPNGFKLEGSELDVRPGGVMRIAMRLPDGQRHQVIGHFTEVEPPAVIAFEGKAVTEDGEVMVAGHNRVVLEEEPGRTRLTFTMTVTTPVSPSDLRSMKESWVEILEKLAANIWETRV